MGIVTPLPRNKNNTVSEISNSETYSKEPFNEHFLSSENYTRGSTRQLPRRRVLRQPQAKGPDATITFDNVIVSIQAVTCVMDFLDILYGGRAPYLIAGCNFLSRCFMGI